MKQLLAHRLALLHLILLIFATENDVGVVDAFHIGGCAINNHQHQHLKFLTSSVSCRTTKLQTSTSKQLTCLHSSPSSTTVSLSESTDAKKYFELFVDLPPTNLGKKAAMKVEPVLSVPSELIIVRYKLPFGLDVVPKKGYAVCTKDGSGGEKVNDILRFTSQWTLGLPLGDGLVSTAAAFSGGLSWQCSMFDVVKAKAWEQVVNALTSNVATKTDEVVLIFERTADGQIPPELM